ncbi:MAG: PAS domain S-box protein [Desulfobacteraceae bacterium]|jgi:PAS domain S-box-containing protein
MTEKQTYKEMGQSEKGMGLDRLFNLSIDMLCVADTNTYFRHINKAFEKTLGYSKDELLRETFLNLIHPDDRASTMAEVEKLSHGEPTIYFENRYRCKNGSYKWLAWTAMPDPEQGLIYAVARDDASRKRIELELQKAYAELEQKVKERTAEVAETNENLIEEIKERRRVEEALRESEKRYRELVDNATEIIYLTDANGYFTFINPTAIRITGYSEEELIGKLYLELIRKDYRKDIERFYRLQFVKKIPNTYHEFPVITKVGKEIWLGQNVRLNVVDDRVMGFQAIARDITDRVQAEEALRESEEFASSLMENSPTPIIVVNEDTSIRYVNPMLEDLTGYTSEEVIGKKAPYPWWIDDPRSGDKSELKRYLLTGVQGLEKLFQKRNGEPFWVEISSTPVTKNAEFKYKLITWVEITKRKRAEEALKAREKELQVKTSNFEEANTALKVLLNKRDEDRIELEEKVKLNMKWMVLPYLERMKKSGLNERQETYRDIVESFLNEITSPFVRKLSSQDLDFTPTEIQVANLVKEGKTTKEIAELLNSSTRAIEFHRENLRAKLALKNKKTNLRSHLLSLS